MTGTPKDRRPPTNAQMITWDELDKMTADNKYPPSARELKINLGWRSSSLILERLRAGIRYGRVVEIQNAAGPHYVPAWWWKMVSENVEKYYEQKS